MRASGLADRAAVPSVDSWQRSRGGCDLVMLGVLGVCGRFLSHC